MLTVHGRPTRFCDGVSRRDFLRIGALGFGTSCLSLTDVLRAEARDGTSSPHKAVINIFLAGGPAHQDTFDLKPDAPAEVRGEFRPIATNVPGIQVGEHLPRTARHMDKFALIRSFRHHNSDHGAADHYILTGYFPQAGFNPGLKPNNQRPAHGSVIARKLGPRGPVPPYVCLPKMHPSAGPAYLGAACAPFVIEADPNAPDFSVPDVVPPPGLAADRLDARKQLLAEVDRFQKAAEARANRDAQAVGVFREKAFALMTSPEAKKAFDIHAEPEKLRDEYGRSSLGQSCLMARRLVEAGVRCVTIDHSNWDTHDNNFATLKRDLLPALDAALSALFRDLADRGLLDSTLVLVTGEFGRTPRINKNAGRDHWGFCQSVLLAGAGVRGGQVYGSSDAHAAYAAEQPVSPDDLAATVFHTLGIPLEHELRDAQGRPLPLCTGRPVLGLF
jgi:hypothetical protein